MADKRIRETTHTIVLDGCLLPVIFAYGGLGLLLGIGLIVQWIVYG